MQKFHLAGDLNNSQPHKSNINKQQTQQVHIIKPEKTQLNAIKYSFTLAIHTYKGQDFRLTI